MQWSRLKHALEDRFAPALRGRVAVFQARYRWSDGEAGRVWIAVDGAEVAAFSTHAGARRREELARELETAGGAGNATDTTDTTDTTDAADALLRRAGEYSDRDALAELEGSLGLTVEAMLDAPSPLLRGLAVLDRRLGKRRLRALPAAAVEHPLVRALHLVRCAAEGVRPPAPAAPPNA
jgi:hypothetical protein